MEESSLERKKFEMILRGEDTAAARPALRGEPGERRRFERGWKIVSPHFRSGPSATGARNVVSSTRLCKISPGDTESNSKSKRAGRFAAISDLSARLDARATCPFCRDARALPYTFCRSPVASRLPKKSPVAPPHGFHRKLLIGGGFCWLRIKWQSPRVRMNCLT